MRRAAAVSLVMVLLAGLAAAQGPIFMPRPPGPPPHPELGKWWKNSEIVKDLQLSEAQIKQIEQTFLDYRLKLIDLRADVERNEARLHPLVEADRPNEQQVGTQIDAVLAARAKLEKTNTMMMLAIRRVLSVEQWKKLQEIQHKREEHFNIRLRGPGGPGERYYFRSEPLPGAEAEEDVLIERHPVQPAQPAPPPQPSPKPGLD